MQSFMTLHVDDAVGTGARRWGVARRAASPGVVSPGGGLPGFGTQMRWLPEYGVGLIAFGNLTYTSWPRTFDAALDALARTGGLQPRGIEPSPALTSARNDVASLIAKWD